MHELVKLIEEIRAKIEGLRKREIKEASTRTIIIEPLLEALGWDVRDMDEVEGEYPTVDNKSVDYALKINTKPVLLVEAKPLNDPLTDVKAITQVVGYAANDGIQWCILTSGIKWRVYSSVEKCQAPDKLLFEVSLDPRDAEGATVQQLAEKMWRFSREEMANGTLDTLGRQMFTDGKVHKALDRIMREPPRQFISLVKRETGDTSIHPQDIRDALGRIWFPGGPQLARKPIPDYGPSGGKPGTIRTFARQLFLEDPSIDAATFVERIQAAFPTSAVKLSHHPWYRNSFRKEGMIIPQSRRSRRGSAPRTREADQTYDESYHTTGKPREVISLYQDIDRFCLGLRTGEIKKAYMAKYVCYRCEAHVFCSVHLQQGGLRVWLSIRFSDIQSPPPFARDVLHVGHWGTGDVELDINERGQIEAALPLIRQSFEAKTR